jgi:hypothetical protein
MSTAVAATTPAPTPTPRPWSLSYGSCTFSGDYNGAPLERSGSCPMQSGRLVLRQRGITAVKNNTFAGMGGCT